MTRTGLPQTVGERPWTVRVYLARGRVCCQWRATRRRLTKSWPDSSTNRTLALRWAKDYAGERRAIARDQRAAPLHLTLGELWSRYRAAKASEWRPKTAKGYAAHAHTLADLLGERTPAEDLGLDALDAYRAARRHAGIGHGQVRREIGFLRQLVTWAHGRGLLKGNRLTAYRYRVPLDEREDAPAEYARADLVAIAAVLAAPQHWRARAAIALCGSLGARVNSVLHLAWDDVDFAAGALTWRPEWDKLGRERVQPMTTRARAALAECLRHRHPTEAWVFWAVRRRGAPYHYNSLWHHLREAEQRAGVAHRPFRAFHGLRRMVVGDIGDLRAAAAWIGDTSLKVVAGSYLRQRAEDVEAGRAAIEGVESGREQQPEQHPASEEKTP